MPADVIAFYEENGFSYTEDQKQKIREVFEELKEKASNGCGIRRFW